jgi:hypothetical protein
MPTMTVKGNVTAATADPADLTAADLRTLLGSTRKFSQTISVSAATFNFNHALGTTDVLIGVYRLVTPFDEIECDVEHTSINAVTLRFAVAVPANEYRAVAIG